MTQASSRNPPNNIPSSFRRAQAPCHPDRAKRAEGSAALLYRPWYLLSLLRQGKSQARCALLSLQRLRLPDSPAAKKSVALLLFGSSFRRKRNGKTLMLSKNAFAAFSIPLFFIQTLASWMLFCRPERSRRICILHVTSSGSREVCWQRQIPRLRSSGPPLGMTGKEKTIGKRNSFPGFSFFDGLSFAFFLFLSCGDAGVSSAFGLVVLVWFVFLFIFAYE